MQTVEQTGHVAEHRVHLGFNLCCVSWVRTHMVSPLQEVWGWYLVVAEKNRNMMTQISLVVLQMSLFGVSFSLHNRDKQTSLY